MKPWLNNNFVEMYMVKSAPEDSYRGTNTHYYHVQHTDGACRQAFLLWYYQNYDELIKKYGTNTTTVLMNL